MDIHLAYYFKDEKPKAPGRKYNCLLAKYTPCPSLIVCMTECLLSEEEEATDTEQVFLVSSVSQSCYDKTAEARHVTRLLQLNEKSGHQKVCPEAVNYLSRVVSVSPVVISIIYCVQLITHLNGLLFSSFVESVYSASHQICWSAGV